jgi:hypothetical protein
MLRLPWLGEILPVEPDASSASTIMDAVDLKVDAFDPGSRLGDGSA